MNSMNERLNFAKDKSFACAVNVLADCRSIQNEFKEDVLAKQLLRFGMPIAEKLEERVGSFKCKDFYYKLPLECKKAGESNYCNRWGMESNFLAKKKEQKLAQGAQELPIIIGAKLKTMRNKVNK